MTSSKITIVDRAQKPMAVGQVIKVLRWGPVWQPDPVEGKIVFLYPEFRSVTLRLTKPTQTVDSRAVPSRYVSVGEQFYVPLPGERIGDVYICETKFVHIRPYYVSGAYTFESWAEIIEDSQALEMARRNLLAAS